MGVEIYIFEMGRPVKIADMARRMIELSGFDPDKDISIVYTGLRPGEKLYEERLMAEEGLQKTPNGMIRIAKPIELDEAYFWNTLDKRYRKAYEETDEMKNYVAELVPTYKYMQ